MIKISLKYGFDPAQMAWEVLHAIYQPKSTEQTILLKPNIGRASSPGTGVCTNPEVVRGAIKFFKGLGKKILVGDGPIWGVDFMQAAESTGIAAVCKDEKVDCIDLDSFGNLELNIPKHTVIEKLNFSKIIRQVDCIVSIPVMKTHMYTEASLSIKNMKGCLYKMEKTKLHRLNKEVPDQNKGRVLDYGISDLARVLLPNYALIDATTAMQGLGPSIGTPLKLDLVFGSAHPLAADMLAAKIMGLDFVPHLNLIQEYLFPDFNFADLHIDPVNFMDFAKTFEPASLQKLDQDYPQIKLLEQGTCSACSAAMMVFLRTHGSKFAQASPFTLATGKDITLADIKTNQAFFIGNCAAKAAKNANKTCCQGCPPVGSSILAHIKGEQVNWD